MYYRENEKSKEQEKKMRKIKKKCNKGNKEMGKKKSLTLIPFQSSGLTMNHPLVIPIFNLL